MQQGHVDGRLNRVGDAVDGVGAQHQQVGAGVSQPTGVAGKQRARLVPGAGRLQRLDAGEVIWVRLS